MKEATRGKSKRGKKSGSYVHDIRYDCVHTDGTDVAHGVPEDELERGGGS